MFKKIVDNIKNIEIKTLKIMISGFKVSFLICIISCIVSYYYIINPISHILFQAGIILFKTGITVGVMSFLCGFIMDKLKKQVI